MTRQQALQKIARIECDNYCGNNDKLISIILLGQIGLVEKPNNELEELYEELTGKPLKITS